MLICGVNRLLEQTRGSTTFVEPFSESEPEGLSGLQRPAGRHEKTACLRVLANRADRSEVIRQLRIA
jgi:hypothetical protein